MSGSESAKDVVIPYKASPESKVKAEKLFAASGLPTKGEFFEHMLSVVEIQQQKTISPQYQKQLAEIEYLGRRMNELFLGMIQTEQAERLRIEEAHAEKVKDLADTITQQQDEITELKGQLSERDKQLKASIEEREASQKYARSLEESVRKDEELLQQLRDKNEQLAGVISSQLAEVEAGRRAVEEHSKTSQQLAEAKALADQRTKQLKEANGALDALKESHAAQLAQIHAEYEREKELLKERHELEKERQLLAVRAENQEHREKDNEKFRSLYEEINTLRRQLAEATANAKRIEE